MARSLTSSPYALLVRLWLKGQIALVVVGVIMYLGSLLLSPQWEGERRLVATLLLPAMLEVLLCSLCLFLAFRVWRRIGTPLRGEGK